MIKYKMLCKMCNYKYHVVLLNKYEVESCPICWFEDKFDNFVVKEV